MSALDGVASVTPIIVLVGTVVSGFAVVYMLSDFAKKSGRLRSAFFYLYCMYLLSNGVDSVMWSLGDLLHLVEYRAFYIAFMAENWYVRTSYGFWNFLVAFTQSMALAFPLQYDKILKRTSLRIIFVLFFTFAFMYDGYTWIVDFDCYQYIYSRPECLDFFQRNELIIAIVNGALSLCAFLFVLFGIYQSSKVRLSQRKRLERRLFIQVFFSSATLCIFSGLFLSSMLTVDNPELSRLLGVIGNYFSVLQHFPPLIILFFVSSSFRNGFFAFYYVDRLLPHSFTDRTTVTTLRSSKTNTLK